MCGRTTRWLAAAGAMGTLALMVYAARPWGNTDAYQDFGGYARLFLLAVWAGLPYLGLVILVKRAAPVKAREIIVLIGALIITIGGLAAYVDAIWLHPDPQGGLAFVAVPLYQWLMVGLLAVLQLLMKKSGNS